MRRRRGFTLVELLTGMGVMALLVLGSMTLFASSLRSLQRTSNDVTMTDQNSRALRKVSETIRQAMSVTVTNSGKTISFNLPAMTAGVDTVTGEKECIVPVVSDGVNRGYNIDFGAGVLRDTVTGKVLVRNLYSKDPDAASSLYNQSYLPFDIVMIGTHRALTINLITRDATSGQARTTRMKTTIILRNM
jgi:prepilin-type N-terminal cleavage/methylation domain-containing protein